MEGHLSYLSLFKRVKVDDSLCIEEELNRIFHEHVFFPLQNHEQDAHSTTVKKNIPENKTDFSCRVLQTRNSVN